MSSIAVNLVSSLDDSTIEFANQFISGFSDICI